MTDDGARAIRLLLATRFVRSIGQGALAVDFALYLRALGWSAVAISALLSAALMSGVVLTLFAGPLSDRGGRKRFLFAYEAAQAIAGVAALAPRNPGFFVLLHWWEGSAEAATEGLAHSVRWSWHGWRKP